MKTSRDGTSVEVLKPFCLSNDKCKDDVPNVFDAYKCCHLYKEKLLL